MSRGRELLAGVLEMSAAELPEVAGIDTVAAWDSLAHMRLVARLEEMLGRELTAEEMLALDGVAAIDALLGGAPN